MSARQVDQLTESSKARRKEQLETVYENGVLRPLQPLGLTDRQRVLVTVNEIADYRVSAKSQLRELGAEAIGLLEVQRNSPASPEPCRR